MSRPRSLDQNFLHDWKVLIIRNVHMKYESSTPNGSKDMAKVRPKVIRNVGQRSQSSSQGHLTLVSFEMVSLVEYIHAKYEVSISYGSNVMAKVKVFSSPEPKARVSYCHSAPSVVRPSVRRRRRRPSSVRKLFTFSTSSPEPLDGF